MEDRSNYISARQLNDDFVALTKDGGLTCWDMATGKVRSSLMLPYNYSNYEVYAGDESDRTYMGDSYPFTLLKSKTPMEMEGMSPSKKQ